MSYNNGVVTFGPTIQKENGQYRKKYIMNSQYINDNIDLIVWDFDNTLIDTHAYRIHSMEPKFIRNELTEEQLKLDFPYWEFFRETVIDLVNKGKYVGIASFGMYKIVRAYMDRIFGMNQKYFTVVNTFARCKIDEPLQQNKNGYILNIMEHYRITNPDRVLLFDDLATNIASAIQIGIAGVLIEGVKYKNGQRICSGLFGPKQLISMEKQLRNTLNSPNPLHIAELGHVGDRKVSIDMYGRRDKCPMNMKKYIYPDSLYIQHNNEPNNTSSSNNTSSRNNTTFTNTNTTPNNDETYEHLIVNDCDNCSNYNIYYYIAGVILLLIIIYIVYIFLGN